MNPYAFVKNQAVIIKRGKRRLLAVVLSVTTAPVGKPGAHRYRYCLKPARLVGEGIARIDAARALDGVKHAQLKAYSGGTTDPWVARD